MACLLFLLYLPKTIRFLTEEKSINIYIFTEFISPTAIRDFEKTTGIKVHVQYYESNEELYAKFKINEGEGYDLITPSDYMVETLKKDRLLQKIEFEKITCWKEINPRLLGHYFDQNNEYSVPLTWSVYGIIYDKFLLKQNTTNIGFDFIFKNPKELLLMGLAEKTYKICMLDDLREVFLIAMLYLFGTVKEIKKEDWLAIEHLLIKQKEWVECYTNFGLKYFLEGNIISFAVMSSRYAARIFDENNVRFSFAIPKNGSLFVIENFAIPIHSKKASWVYKFINFMNSRKYNTYHFNEYGGSPVIIDSYQDINQKYFKSLQFFPDDELFNKLYLIHNNLPMRKIEEVWLRVKTA